MSMSHEEQEALLEEAETCFVEWCETHGVTPLKVEGK